MAERRWSRRAALGLALSGSATALVVARRTSRVDVGAAAGVRSTPSELPILSAAPAPSLGPASGWLNSPPLTVADLVGRVVLYDFWTFACVNCQHTVPSVIAWDARYRVDGLTVASIHTPEFDYEADPASVQSFVAAHGIAYPVALDPKRLIWRAFDNHYWPAFYLYDRQGRWRYHQIGEGGYADTEDAIRSLLGVAAGAARAVA